MKFQVHVTRMAKQFAQVTVEAANPDDAEEIAKLKEISESDWEMESAGGSTVEDVRAA